MTATGGANKVKTKSGHRLIVTGGEIAEAGEFLHHVRPSCPCFPYRRTEGSALTYLPKAKQPRGRADVQIWPAHSNAGERIFSTVQTLLCEDKEEGWNTSPLEERLKDTYPSTF